MDSQPPSNAQYEKLKALHRHATILEKTQSIEEIAEYTIDAMEKALGFNWVGFGIVEDNLFKHKQHMRDTRTETYWEMPLDGPGITVRAIRTGESQLIADTRKDVDWVGVNMDDSAFSRLDADLQGRIADGKGNVSLSELDVPVKIDDTVVALLGAESRELNAFNEQDQELLETLASHVASAIQRIRLLETQFQYEAKLEALHAHANKLSNANSIEEIEEHTIDAIMNTLGFLWVNFAIVEDNFLKSTLHIHEDASEEPVEEVWWYPLDGPGITVLAARTGESQLITDTRKDADFIEIDIEPSILSKLDDDLRARAFSQLEVPVKIGQAVVAVLGGESAELNGFNEQDQKLFETLATHVASAIQRIRAKEEVRQLAYKLNNLKPGGCYISESHDRLLKAYAVLSMEDVPGLCIVRENPRRLVDNYGIKKEEIVLLSSRPFEDYETLDDLQSLSRVLTSFLESGEGVVLLDGLEYLISRFGFDAVYSFVQEKRFDFLSSKAVLLVPLEMKTLNEQERALLSSEFTLLE